MLQGQRRRCEPSLGELVSLEGTMGGVDDPIPCSSSKKIHIAYLNCETHFYGRNGKGSHRFEVHMLYILSVLLLLYIFNMLGGQSFFRFIQSLIVVALYYIVWLQVNKSEIVAALLPYTCTSDQHATTLHPLLTVAFVPVWVPCCG